MGPSPYLAKTHSSVLCASFYKARTFLQCVGKGRLIPSRHGLQLGLRQAGMSELGLQMVDRRLRLGQCPFCLLAHRAYRGDCGFGCLESVGRGIRGMIAAPVQHGHRNLAVLREAPPLATATEPVGRASATA